ncbi:site-specific integrase [Vibrio tasmaniensis]|uniref:site-specific integrase n=1 Tax=Vibrio tasmaniensis TaxID=212663 RepID=UPI001080478C|nr:site-specific integrase [Vibrio tasmaniensis]
MNKLGKNVAVQIYKDTDGYNFPLIVRSGVFPACLYLNAYLNGNHSSPLSTGTRRNNSQAPSFYTLKSYAYELKFLYCYFIGQDVDLVERVSSGEFLSRLEVDDFVKACKLYTDRETIDRFDIVSITDKRVQDAIHATLNSQPQVSAHTLRQRLTRLRAYIEYLYICHHYDQEPTKTQANIDDKFNRFKLYINTFISSTRRNNTIVKDAFEAAVPSDKFFRLLEIVKESSPDNPFRSSKLRNQIIMQILINTGVRVGAVLKLKINDLVDDWGNPRFLLTRTPNDPTDPRLERPSNKTKAVSVSISSELMKLIKLYIKTTRTKYPISYEHDFIFISERGRTSGLPLTYKSIHKIVDKFGESLAIKLHPHKLRHKWNEVFEERAREHGLEPEKIEDLRKYAMGWVEESRMASIYNEYQLATTVADISSKTQSKALPNLGDDNES